MLAALKLAALIGALCSVATAQTYRRLGACPTLGCVLPPDQAEFIPGQYFDLRVEVHAPVNGSEAAHDGEPDKAFTVSISKDGGEATSFADYFELDEPQVEEWSFGWYEDLFAEDNDEETLVNVAAKAYRRIQLNEPGTYEVTLKYYGSDETKATWTVREIVSTKTAKNVILFIGDGMTTNMITAARLLGHKSINGKYQSTMQMDKFPIIGHQMTHSIDSFITDSANSASALYTGHKSTVNAMGVYADSSPDAFDDPKVETITELLVRHWGAIWGAVSTAYIADATPTALTAHTRNRGFYGPLVDQALNGLSNYTWTDHGGPTVYFGAGAEQFYPGEGSYQGKDYYEEFAEQGYKVAINNTALLALPNDQKALGIFCQSNLPVWLDRNVYTENLAKNENSPLGGDEPALDLPGLKEMTVKAVEILHERGGEEGFFLMSEAASIDKQMHALDYDRALGDLLELDDAVKATVAKLEELGVLEETLVIVTADHGHGFDVFGNADTKYLQQQDDDRQKRRAVGTYAKSGLSQYTEGELVFSDGANFPSTWEPRYAIAAGVAAAPDHREDHVVAKSPRSAVTKVGSEYYVNAEDSPDGFLVNGTLPTGDRSGVHSLTDVPVYAMGPCQDTFSGTYNNVDVFYKMAECLGLARGGASKFRKRRIRVKGH